MKNVTARAHSHTVLEAAFERDRLWVWAAVAAACLLCWAWMVPLALDMNGAMDGAAAWMGRVRWSLAYGVALCGMWVVMMVGMMLPAAAPAILLYARVVRSADSTQVCARIGAFLGGYLLVWTAFSLAASLLQCALSSLAYLSPMMQLRNVTLSGAVLLIAGLYQLTPAKRSCLTACRAPAEFIARYYRPGTRGALQLGLRHGFLCLACCWALMLLLFVAGVMNLLGIAAITILVLLEKTAPYGIQSGRLSGILLIVGGALLVVH